MGVKEKKKKDHHTKRAVLMTAQALIDAQFTWIIQSIYVLQSSRTERGIK